MPNVCHELRSSKARLEPSHFPSRAGLSLSKLELEPGLNLVTGKMEEDGPGRRQVPQQKSRLKPESREKFNIRKILLTEICSHTPLNVIFSALESDILCLLTNPGSSFMVNLELLEPIWTRAEPARAHGLARLEQARGKHYAGGPTKETETVAGAILSFMIIAAAAQKPVTTVAHAPP